MKYLRAVLIWISLAFSALVLLPTAQAESNDMTILLAGQKEDVLALLRKAIEAEFPDGVRNNAPKGVGYQIQFRTFFSGTNVLSVRLFPMADGNATEPTGFLVGFDAQSSPRHANGLIEQIKKLAPATQGSVQLVGNRDQYRRLGEQAKVCQTNLARDERIAQLGTKVALGRSTDASLAMLADSTRPSDVERQQIEIWSSLRASCVGLLKTDFGFLDPDPRMGLLLAQFDAADRLVLALYKGELSFGEFNERRKSLVSMSQSQIAETAARLEKERGEQMARQQELARQQEIEARRMAIEQQKADAMTTQATKPPPMRSVLGTTCRSQQLGNQVHTTCD